MLAATIRPMATVREDRVPAEDDPARDASQKKCDLPRVKIALPIQIAAGFLEALRDQLGHLEHTHQCLPPKTACKAASALIRVFTVASYSLFFLMYSQRFLVSAVRWHL